MQINQTDYNTKITGIEGKIPNVSSLATKTTLTTVENKIHSVRSLVEKANYNTKITDIENILVIIMIKILQFQNLIL